MQFSNTPIPGNLTISSITNTTSNVSPVGATGSFSINDWIMGRDTIGSHIKKYEIYDLNEDLLALSVAWKRLRDSNVPNSVSRITDLELFKKVSHEDRETANNIADYYSKKIMTLKLKGINRFSNYRTDLNEFIHSDRKKVTDRMFGLAYNLPKFYEYDTQFDMVKAHVNIRPNWELNNSKYHRINKQLTLTPISKLRRKTKGVDCWNYWFKTEQDIALNIPISHNNTLMSMWDYIFNTNTKLVLQGQTHCKEIDGFEYLMLADWHIVQA